MTTELHICINKIKIVNVLENDRVKFEEIVIWIWINWYQSRFFTEWSDIIQVEILKSSLRVII